MVQMNRSHKPVDFNSPVLTTILVKEAYKASPRWFEHVSYKFRDNFALKYGTKTWNVSPTGNPVSIVVSYPRQDGTVRIYDLDSGEFYWVKLTMFTKSRVYGRAREEMYNYSGVLMDDYRCESEDIEMNIDWESLQEWDAQKGKISYWKVSRSAAKLIALPRRVKVNKD